MTSPPETREAAAPTKETAAQLTKSRQQATDSNDRLQQWISVCKINPLGAMFIQRDVTVAAALEEIRSGCFAAEIGKIRTLVIRLGKDHADVKAAKLALPAYLFSGRIEGRVAKAMTEGRFQHSGLLQLDFDNIEDPEEMRDTLIQDPHVLAAWLSPSGNGVKGLALIPQAATEDEHKAAFLAVESHFAGRGWTLDKACKNTNRLCFAGWDSELRTREDEPQIFLPAAQQKTAPPATAPVIRSRGFPDPPANGIHQWLPLAARWCESNGMTEAEAIEKLRSCEGQLRRKYSSDEPEDACRLVYSTPRQSQGVTRIREAVAPNDFPDLTRFGESDADNALRVQAVAGGNFHHVLESGQWLVWDGCRWAPDKDGKMVRLFLTVMDGAARQGLEAGKGGESLVKFSMRCRDRAKVAAGLEMLKSVRGVTVSANDLDADPWLLGTPNGLIDLRTGQPVAPDKQALVTKSIACDFDPQATCPTWKTVIATAAAGDAELIQFLQAWTGYTLTGSVKEECLAFLHGTGANSKGTVTECIRALMGDYAITAPESLFVADRNSSATNDIARLSGCRMACAAELDENASFAESRLKAITGRDAITARFLHKEFFDFQPTHKFWISGNHKPTVRGVDHGIWRRIRLIPFTVTIPKEERDLELADKLRAELPGILNWALAGCRLWQREGLQTPQCVAHATAEYQAAEDVVGQFLDATTATDPEDRTLQSSLFEAYQAWGMKQGIRKLMSATMLNRKLEERGMKRSKIRGGIFWVGIALKSEGGQETCPL